MLLDKGADPNAQGGEYGNALYAASAGGYEGVVEMLLDKGADPNAQGGEYGNALQAAANRGHIRVLELLMLKQPAMPLHDRYGRTLLWWAAAGGDTSTVHALVTQYNLDPRTPNKFGQTPLWIAANKGHVDVTDYLANKCGGIDIQQQAISKDYNNGTFVWCDVCTVDLKEGALCYYCRYCIGGNWDMCADCKERGAICEDATHTLEKRTIKEGHRVELIS
jgi:ankyrin repeat protein